MIVFRLSLQFHEHAIHKQLDSDKVKHLFMCVISFHVIYWLLSGLGEPSYFYVESVFALHGVMMAIFFLFGTYLRYVLTQDLKTLAYNDSCIFSYNDNNSWIRIIKIILCCNINCFGNLLSQDLLSLIDSVICSMMMYGLRLLVSVEELVIFNSGFNFVSIAISVNPCVAAYWQWLLFSLIMERYVNYNEYLLQLQLVDVLRWSCINDLMHLALLHTKFMKFLKLVKDILELRQASKLTMFTGL